MNDTLPEPITEALDEFANAVENTMSWSHAPGDWESRVASRASLVSAILDYARKERERGLAEALAGCKDCGVSIHDHGYEPGAPGDEGRVICPAPPSPGERERGATLPPEIVGLLRDVASGPCMPDLRGRAGAALVRRDLVTDCQRCGGSGYERIGDGSANAWGACEVCRPAPSRSERTEDAEIERTCLAPHPACPNRNGTGKVTP